jgi:hypothetical protein
MFGEIASVLVRFDHVTSVIVIGQSFLAFGGAGDENV